MRAIWQGPGRFEWQRLLLLLAGLSFACGGKSAASTNTRGAHESDAGAAAAKSSRNGPSDKGSSGAGSSGSGSSDAGSSDPSSSDAGNDARPLSDPADAPADGPGDDATPDAPAPEATPAQPEGSTPTPNPNPEPAVVPSLPMAPATPAACGASDLPGADPNRVAEALAFALWGQPAPDELLRAAQTGELHSAEGLERQVRRLIDDERGQTHLAGFGHWWLGPGQGREWELVKDPELFPEFDATLFEAMRRETDLFLQSLMSDQTATLGTLLGADYTFANKALGALYGLDLAGDEFERVALDPERRAGLFTQPFFLSLTTRDASDPVRRGLFLRDRLLCGPLPPAPPAIDSLPGPPSEDQTTEAYYRQLLDDPSCRACHSYFTWTGFAFEHYDAIGRYRPEERGLAIDSTATVILADGTREYAEATAMLRDLATTEDAERCMAQQWLAFLLGRDSHDAAGPLMELELEPGACAQADGEPVPCTEPVTLAARAHRAIECAVDGDGQLNLRELIVALASSEPLMSGTSACGNARCLNDLEFCYEYRRASDTAVGIEPTCYPYQAGESDCETSYAAATDCSCEVLAGGAHVLCQE